ncbi:MAG TPA: hypothetical protein VL461_10710 [Dictyobacter sp.]|jgi:ABC-2 type transport system permease protein|nr:hypothetical protein [Dictyobacter sp.]
MIIHSTKLRWLFWLRWKMFTRGFTRNVASIIGSIVLFLFVFSAGVAIAIGTYFAYRFLPSPENTEVLYLVLTALYVLWIILPVLEFTANEGLDISKLALFPLTRGELMSSLIVSTLLDIPTIGLVLVLAAVVVGWATSLPLALMALLTMLIFYVQLVAISQLVLALLQRVLQSRRFRDLSIIIVILLSSSGYACNIAARTIFTKNTAGTILHASFSSYLQWLPPGMAARAIQEAAIGNWGISFVWLAALLIISGVLLYCWQLIVERGLTAAESGGTARATRRRQNRTMAANAPVQVSQSNHLIPVPIAAIIQKEWKYYWRDPQIKAVFLQSLLSVIFLIVYFGFNFVSASGSGNLFSRIGSWAILIVPLFPLLSLFGLTYNTLGLERQSLTTLFLLPIKPVHLLIGKNVAIFVVGIIELIVLLTITLILTHAWALTLPAVIVGLTGIFTTIGLGNFTSVMLPQKMRLARRGFQTQGNLTASGGCLRTLMSGLAFYALIAILIPVGAAVALPIIFHLQWLWIITLPAALAYGLVIYGLVTWLVAPRILTKAPEILAVVTKE